MPASSSRSSQDAAARPCRVGVLAGAVAPVLLAVVFGVLTLTERSFLRRSGWSAVHRTQVAWPSLLELGPHGWLMQVAFVVCGALGAVFAICAYVRLPGRSPAVGAILLGLMSLAVAAMALPPDPPATTTHSWHNAAHNAIYPVIPVCGVLAAAAFANGLRALQRRRAAQALVVFVVIAVIGFAASLIDEVAQLGRFVLLAALFGWILSLALMLGAVLSPSAPPCHRS